MARAKSLRSLATEAIATHASVWMWKGLAAIVVSMVGLSFASKIAPPFSGYVSWALIGLGAIGLVLFVVGLFRPAAPN